MIQDKLVLQERINCMADGFLPVTKKEMIDEGLSQMDFVYVCGDAYVDHPSFGMAIITRVLQAAGYHVGIICQPDWNDPASIDVFGEPRLGFMVSAGNMDSLVNHYTVAKRHRGTDAYSPGGQMGRRPDRAVIVYCNLIRKTYKHTPIIIGGIDLSSGSVVGVTAMVVMSFAQTALVNGNPNPKAVFGDWAMDLPVIVPVPYLLVSFVIVPAIPPPSAFRMPSFVTFVLIFALSHIVRITL